ncbi:MATE family efflux transporter [Mobilibacterium timonense]|uniref:MATE family efflux transporter n=1 Tax=Mobilibacterium timonense TaxID=1871012 RepID=UPI0009862078|nr:MATE family efflux transporter [Mobilibacterium timonense]
MSTASESKRKYIFESAPVSKAVWSMAIPTVVTQLINIIYNYADTWYVGRTANAAMVAALGVSFPMFVIMAAIANLFGIGGASVISRALGEGNRKKARETFATCFWFGLLGAVVYMAVINLFRSRIIYLVGGDENDFQYVSSYMFWTMIIGAIPSVGNVLCGHLVRSIGASKEAGIGMSMGGILNIILDPIFMFVILPDGMEVTGAAMATLISNTAAFIYFLIYMKRRDIRSSADDAEQSRAQYPGIINLKLPEAGAIWPALSPVLLIGFPAALQTTLAMVSNIFANVLIRPYGSSAVAGMGVAKKINMIAFNTCMGMTMGVLPLLGYSFGAKNFNRMRRIIRYTGTVVVLFGSACTAVFVIGAPEMIRFFIDESGSVEYGTEFLRIIGFAAPMAALSYLAYTVFQSAGMEKSAFILSILRKGVLDIPGMFILRAFMEARGVCLATPVAEILSVFIGLFLYASFRRKIDAMDVETGEGSLSA